MTLSALPYKLTGDNIDPIDIDYDILGLQKKRFIVKGELVKVEYYRTYDGITYTDLLLEENRTYNKDALGIAQTRGILINWFLEDGSVGCTKGWTKYYSPDEAIQEGITRRNNMISVAKVVLLDMLKSLHGEPANQMYSFDLLTSVKDEMKYFTDGHTQPLRDSINTSTKSYLTQAIKDAVITELTF